MIGRFALFLLVAAVLSSCIQTRDLAKTLRYSDNKAVSVSELNFQELRKMKKGSSCTYNFLLIPMFGDGSIISAADKGNINRVQLVGETAFWMFPIVKNCTVVFGDIDNISSVISKQNIKQ